MKITIDGKEIEAVEGQSVLEAARAAGIGIPALCYHPDLCVKANCRLCVVQIEGIPAPQTACSTKIKEGMKVMTNSDAVNALRKTNIELILGEHRRNCPQCIWQGKCALLKYAAQFKANMTANSLRKPESDICKFGPIILDRSKCIECRNCVDMCARQTGSRRGTDTEMKDDGFLEIDGRGKDLKIKPSRDSKKDCIYCGQCIAHCPVGALDSESPVEEIDALLKDRKGQTLIIQFAPSIRTSIGEPFGVEPGINLTGQLVTVLKKIGFDKVFDVNMAADLTTVEEAKELVWRVTKKKPLPMFTSCCPGWMRYLEFYRPDMIPNITTVKSPQNMLGSLIKTYWAGKNNIDPKNIKVVSVMPCTAKKYDITKPEEKINGMNPIDYVLTTRELARLLQKNKINLKADMEQAAADDPFGVYTGAGTIFGATGGVTEAATRTAYWLITGKNLEKVDCENVRGIVGLKRAEVAINGLTLRVGIANGMENAKIILDDLARDPKAYDYIEIMACSGGCIGGGGQPLPVNDEIRRKRAAGLYADDRSKKLRFAHESPAVREVYGEYFKGDERKIHAVLHTSYNKKDKSKIEGQC